MHSLWYPSPASLRILTALSWYWMHHHLFSNFDKDQSWEWKCKLVGVHWVSLKKYDWCKIYLKSLTHSSTIYYILFTPFQVVWLPLLLVMKTWPVRTNLHLLMPSSSLCDFYAHQRLQKKFCWWWLKFLESCV